MWRGWLSCPIFVYSVAYLKPFNVAAYIKTERIFEKDKTETTKTAATTALYQSAVRLLSLCSESVFLFQQTLSVNTPVTLSN